MTLAVRGGSCTSQVLVAWQSVCLCWQSVQVENCTFGDMPFSLPGSLRILSMKCEQVPLESQLSTLLRDCRSLEVRFSISYPICATGVVNGVIWRPVARLWCLPTEYRGSCSM